MTAPRVPPGPVYGAAVAHWPEIRLAPERFEATWSRLSDTTDGPLVEHANDLYLVAACLEGVPEALAQLKAIVSQLAPQLRGLGLSPTDLDELVAATLSHLLAGPGAKRLSRYSARGPLEGWLRVVMTNRALSLRRTERTLEQLDDVLLGDSHVDSAPELELLRQRFRGSFSEGFAAALARLTPRQRNLLRQHHLDELSLEELGAFYRIHRATAARWLADARTALLEFTRDEVAKRFGVNRHEVDSIVRVVGSRLDISAGLFLHTGERS